MAPGDIARAYHELTKHTPDSIRRPTWAMDWDNKPHPFKTYDDDLERVVPSEPLGRILRLGAGVLRKREHDDGTFYFRTYASAGALYPIELYVVDSDGVFHVDPLGKELVRLRHEGADGVYIVVAGLPWRTCWKYGNRGYRHLFWDAGTILANVLALCADEGLVTRVVLGFDDDAVSRLIGVDGVTEFPLCIVEVGGSSELTVAPDVAPLELRVRPLSATPHRFDALEEVHAAGRLRAEDVDAWRGEPLESPALATLQDVEHVIRRRGSARTLGPGPITEESFDEILRYGAQPFATDHGFRSLRLFLAVHSVDGLPQGTYVWTDGSKRRLRRRDVRADAAYLCLGQRLGGEGAATVFLMSDVDAALHRLGDRGYRVAQLEGGIALGRLDLAAHAHQLGASGLTFFDDDVRGFFSPEASGLDCIVVCSVGERRGRLLPLA